MRTTPKQQRASTRIPRTGPGIARVPEAPEPPGPGQHRLRRLGRLGRAARAVSGSLAAGSCVLAILVTGMQLWAIGHGQQGPGPASLTAHLAVGGIALALQPIADRRADTAGNAACAAVFVIVLGSLWYWWWA